MPTCVSGNANAAENDSYSKVRGGVSGGWIFLGGVQWGRGKFRQAKNCTRTPSQIFYKFFTLSEPARRTLTLTVAH